MMISAVSPELNINSHTLRVLTLKLISDFASKFDQIRHMARPSRG